MDLSVLRAAAAAIMAVTGRAVDVKAAAAPKPRAIDRLLEAKKESDRRNYRAKHAIMRALMQAHPHEFAIDSEANGIVGVTHVSTGFRMHLPRRVLPASIGGHRGPALV